MDSKLEEMAPTRVARRRMVISMAKKDNIEFASNGSFKDVPTEVAKTGFRTQPVATGVSATESVDNTSTCTRENVHFLVRTSQCTIHTLTRTFPMPSHRHWLKIQGMSVALFYHHCHLFVMSLLNVPFIRFPPVASSPTCSLSRRSASTTSLERARLNACSSAHWSGMSGCFANLTQNTGYEPNICAYINEEHTPIHLPDSNRNFLRHDDATIIFTTEDPEGFPHSGASSSSKQTAASRVPTVLRS